MIHPWPRITLVSWQILVSGPDDRQLLIVSEWATYGEAATELARLWATCHSGPPFKLSDLTAAGFMVFKERGELVALYRLREEQNNRMS